MATRCRCRGAFARSRRRLPPTSRAAPMARWRCAARPCGSTTRCSQPCRPAAPTSFVRSGPPAPSTSSSGTNGRRRCRAATPIRWGSGSCSAPWPMRAFPIRCRTCRAAFAWIADTGRSATSPDRTTPGSCGATACWCPVVTTTANSRSNWPAPASCSRKNFVMRSPPACGRSGTMSTRGGTRSFPRPCGIT